jgi:RNA polymerase sigma-70 factor (ECF subfamily)
VRDALTAEAIRLTRLVRGLLPDDGEAGGLLALMLFTEARRAARISPAGDLVTIDEQDRTAWNPTQVAEARQLVQQLAPAQPTAGAPGRYQLLAGINAVHAAAADMSGTDWAQIVALYDTLSSLDPSPIVAMNRAIAIAELDGPAVALALVDRLDVDLAGYYAWHATRADLLRRLDRDQEAREAYDRAIQLAANAAEAANLARRRERLSG